MTDSEIARLKVQLQQITKERDLLAEAMNASRGLPLELVKRALPWVKSYRTLVGEGLILDDTIKDMEALLQ